MAVMTLWRTTDRHVVLWTLVLRVFSSCPFHFRAFRYTFCPAFPYTQPRGLSSVSRWGIPTFPVHSPWVPPPMRFSVRYTMRSMWARFPLIFPVYLRSVPHAFFRPIPCGVFIVRIVKFTSVPHAFIVHSGVVRSAFPSPVSSDIRTPCVLQGFPSGFPPT